MSGQPLMGGRQYLMKLGYKEVTATITDIKHREDVNTGAHLAASALAMERNCRGESFDQRAGGI